MSTFLNRATSALAAHVDGLAAIVLRGSQQDPSVVDFWSDCDLVAVLRPGLDVDEGALMRVIHGLGPVLGSERHSQPGSQYVLYRAAIGFGAATELLDLAVYAHAAWRERVGQGSETIVFGQLELQTWTPQETRPERIGQVAQEQIDPVWFKYFVAIKKFCRDDHLIGMHLLLDLIREYLVLEMIERDRRQKTSIHRFGYNEHMPEDLRLSHLDTRDKDAVLRYIGRLAGAYDRQLKSLVADYESRSPAVLDYVEQSRQHLRRGPAACPTD